MSVRILTIDFWNTLVDSSNGEGRNRHRAEVLIAEAAHLGVELTYDQVMEAGQNAWAFFRRIWLDEVRTPLTHEMVDHIWEELGLPDNAEAKARVEDVYKKGILDHPPAILPGVAKALPALAEHFTLGIVSDTAISSGEILKEVLDNEGLLKYFSHFSFSDETGVAKPHPRAYTTILDPANAKPHEALHIGDIERTDVAGARDLDMFAILYAGDHINSVVKSDITATRAHIVAHHWDDIVRSILDGHIWR